MWNSVMDGKELRGFDVPSWVPQFENGHPADVYVVGDTKTVSGGRGVCEELVLSNETMKSGHAEWRQAWEFDTCIPDAAANAPAGGTSASSGASVAGNTLSSTSPFNVKLAASVNQENFAKLRENVRQLRRKRPRKEQRLVLYDDRANDSGDPQHFPLQKPNLNTAFDAFLVNLAYGPIASVTDDVPLGSVISRSLGKTLELMMDREVSPQCATWFIRVAVLNELPNKIRPDRPPPTPKWFWFKLGSEHMKAELEAFRVMSVALEAVEGRKDLWRYFISLLRYQTDEGLVDENACVRAFLSEIRKEVLNDYDLDDAPGGSLVYRKELFNMILFGIEQFEPEFLAYRESANALFQILSSALSSQSPRISPFQRRILAISLRCTRRLEEIACAPDPEKSLKANVDMENSDSIGEGEDLEEKSDSEQNNERESKLSGAHRAEFSLADSIAKFPGTGDLMTILQHLRAAFRSNSLRTKFVCEWALRSPCAKGILSKMTAGTVISALAAELPVSSRGEKPIPGEFRFQRVILQVVEKVMSGGESTPVQVAELLYHLHSVGEFSLPSYYREARSILSKNNELCRLHCTVIENIPETVDRSATLLRRSLLNRYRRTQEVIVEVDGQIIRDAISGNSTRCRQAGRKLRIEHSLCSRLTHCEIVARMASTTTARGLFIFFEEARALFLVSSLIMKQLKRFVASESKDPSMEPVLSSIPRLATAIVASGGLGELLEGLLALSAREPQPVISCLDSLASSFQMSCPMWQTYIRSAILKGSSALVSAALRGEAGMHKVPAALQSIILSGQRSIGAASEFVADPYALVEGVVSPLIKALGEQDLPRIMEIEPLFSALTKRSMLVLIRALAEHKPRWIESLLENGDFRAAVLPVMEELPVLLDNVVPQALAALLRPDAGRNPIPNFDLDLAPVQLADIFNAPFCQQWLQARLQQGSLSDPQLVELSKIILEKLEMEPKLDVMVFQMIDGQYSAQLRGEVVEAASVLFREVLQSFVTAAAQVDARPVDSARLNARDESCSALLLCLDAKGLDEATCQKVRAEIREQLLSVKKELEQVSPDDLMQELALGRAVIRRIEVLKWIGLAPDDLESTTMLLDLFEVIAPALHEEGVDITLSCLRASEEVCAANKRRDEKSLKKRVVTSNVHYWLSPRQRITLFALFSVGRGMNGAYRRVIVAFVRDRAKGRRLLDDNWILLEGQAENSILDTASFGIQTHWCNGCPANTPKKSSTNVCCGQRGNKPRSSADVKQAIFRAAAM